MCTIRDFTSLKAYETPKHCYFTQLFYDSRLLSVDNLFILLLSNLEVKSRITVFMLQINLPEMCMWMMMSALGPPLCKTQML